MIIGPSKILVTKIRALKRNIYCLMEAFNIVGKLGPRESN